MQGETGDGRGVPFHITRRRVRRYSGVDFLGHQQRLGICWLRVGHPGLLVVLFLVWFSTSVLSEFCSGWGDLCYISAYTRSEGEIDFR